MQYSFISACLLALTSTVMAQTAGFAPITKPTQNEVIAGGSPYTITWQPTGPSGKVSLILLQGATPATLQLGATIASAIDSTAGSFTWSVPATSSFATYGIKLQLDADPATFQYSFPFSITGVNGPAIVSSSSSSSSSISIAPAQSTTTQQVSQVSSRSASTSSVPQTLVSMTSSTAAISSVASVASVSVSSQTSYSYPNSTIVTPTGASRTGSSSSANTGSASGTSSANTAQQTVNAAPGLSVCGGFMGFAALTVAMLV